MEDIRAFKLEESLQPLQIFARGKSLPIVLGLLHLQLPLVSQLVLHDELFVLLPILRRQLRVNLRELLQELVLTQVGVVSLEKMLSINQKLLPSGPWLLYVRRRNVLDRGSH